MTLGRKNDLSIVYIYYVNDVKTNTRTSTWYSTYQQPWSAACDAPHKLRQEKRSNVTEKNSATRSIHTRSDSRSTYVSSACRSAVRLSAVSCRLMSLLNVLDTTPLDTILHVHQYIV